MAHAVFPGSDPGDSSGDVPGGTVTGAETSQPPTRGVGGELTLVSAAAAPSAAVPMDQPPGAWGLLVTGVDLDRADTGRVELFIGHWLGDDASPRPDDRDPDDLVLRVAPAQADGLGVAGDRVNVEMLLPARRSWHVVGRWPVLGTDWPHVVGPTAAAVMGLVEACAVAGVEWPFTDDPPTAGTRVASAQA